MLQNEPRLEPSPRERLERTRVLARRAKAYWRSAIVVFLLVAGVAGLVIWRLPRIYMSETLLLVQPMLHTGSRDDLPNLDPTRLGPKLKDRLLVRSRLERILRELNLYPSIVEKRGIQDAIDEMRLHLGFRARDSDTYLISFQAEDPALAQTVARKVADSLIEEFLSEGVRRAVMSRDFLIDEERRAAGDLEEKGKQFSTFIAQHPEFAYDPTRQPGLPLDLPRLPSPLAPDGLRPAASLGAGDASGSGAARRPANDPQLAGLLREKARVESELALALGGRAQDSGDSVAKPGATLQQERQKLASELAAAQADLADKRRRYTDEHPDLISARNRAVAVSRALAEVDRQIAGVAGPPATKLEPHTAELERRLTELKAAIAARDRALAASTPTAGGGAGARSSPVPPFGSGPKLDGFVALESEWRRLMQAVNEARRAKDDVSDRKARAELLASAAQSSGSIVMSIVDPAFLPVRPIKPNRRLAAGVSLGSALVLAMLWAMAGVLLSDVVRDAGDLEANGATVLGVLPKEHTRARAGSALATRVVRSVMAPTRRTAAQDAKRAARSGRIIITDPSSRDAVHPAHRVLSSGTPLHGEEESEADSRVASVPNDACHAHASTSGNAPRVCDPDEAGTRSAPRTSLLAPADSLRGKTDQLTQRHCWSYPMQAHGSSPEFEDATSNGRRGGGVDPSTVLFETVPEIGLQSSGLLTPSTLSALRLLRHWIEQHHQKGCAAVGITSATRGEGKTRLSAQLALALAESERASVLLIEANFERPALEKTLRMFIPPGYGFSAQIRRRMAEGPAFAWGVVRLAPTLHALVESMSDVRFPAALHSREFAQAIAELRRRYDYIVVDGPSILDGGNATSVEAAVDGMLMVARSGVSKGSHIRRAGKRLGTRRLFGVVLTDVEEHIT